MNSLGCFPEINATFPPGMAISFRRTKAKLRFKTKGQDMPPTTDAKPQGPGTTTKPAAPKTPLTSTKAPPEGKEVRTEALGATRGVAKYSVVAGCSERAIDSVTFPMDEIQEYQKNSIPKEFLDRAKAGDPSSPSEQAPATVAPDGPSTRQEKVVDQEGKQVMAQVPEIGLGVQYEARTNWGLAAPGIRVTRAFNIPGKNENETTKPGPLQRHLPAGFTFPFNIVAIYSGDPNKPRAQIPNPDFFRKKLLELYEAGKPFTLWVTRDRQKDSEAVPITIDPKEMLGWKDQGKRPFLKIFGNPW